jgi:ribose/xylose/arabinose/galactoside ABC-type transport system permease subunit
VAGAVFIQLLTTTLVSHNVPDSGARIVQAVIIIAAIYLQRPTRRTG